MKYNRNRRDQQKLTRAVLHRGGHLYEAEYILGTLRPPTLSVPEKVRRAKTIWDNGGSVEEVVKALTP